MSACADPKDCRYEERSDSEGSWEVCVTHDANYPCDVDVLAKRLRDVAADRDMYREKAHRFIKTSGSYDRRLGEIVYRLQLAIVKAETLAQQTVPTGHLRWILGDDEPEVQS